MLSAIFYDQPEFGVKHELGRVTLQGGVAQIDPALQGIATTRIYDSFNDPEQNIPPTDGERYIRALPVVFRGGYFWAELQEPTLAERVDRARTTIGGTHGETAGQ